MDDVDGGDFVPHVGGELGSGGEDYFSSKLVFLLKYLNSLVRYHKS